MSTGSSRRRRSRPNTIGGVFRWHLIEMVESPAWRALSLSARQCLDRIEIELAHHGGRDNGALPVTHRDFVTYGVWAGGVAEALAELEVLGFIQRKPGKASIDRAKGRAAHFRLLCRHGRGAGPPAEDQHWKRFKTLAEADAVAKQARARVAARRKPASETEALASASETEALPPASETEALVAFGNRGTIYSLGSEREAAQSSDAARGPGDARSRKSRYTPAKR